MDEATTEEVFSVCAAPWPACSRAIPAIKTSDPVAGFASPFPLSALPGQLADQTPSWAWACQTGSLQKVTSRAFQMSRPA